MHSVNIIIGSQMGSAEYIGEQLAEQLISQGIETEVHDQPNFSEINQDNTVWLLCTSTYGAGDYPDNLLSFIEDLNQTDDLKGLKFSVIGLGDTSYDTYNQAGRNVEQLMLSKGATCTAPRLELNILDDDLPEDTALAWLPQWITLNNLQK